MGSFVIISVIQPFSIHNTDIEQHGTVNFINDSIMQHNLWNSRNFGFNDLIISVHNSTLASQNKSSSNS